MGVRASAKMILGFEVTLSDFWKKTVVVEDAPSCPNGHPGPHTGKFCQECGAKITPRRHERWEPTEGFAKFCASRNRLPKEVVDREEWPYERALDGDFHPFDVFPTPPSQDEMTWMDKTPPVALAIELGRVEDLMVGGYVQGKTNLSDKDLAELFEKARMMAVAIGIPDRQVRLWLTTYAG